MASIPELRRLFGLAKTRLADILNSILAREVDFSGKDNIARVDIKLGRFWDKVYCLKQQIREQSHGKEAEEARLADEAEEFDDLEFKLGEAQDLLRDALAGLHASDTGVMRDTHPALAIPEPRTHTDLRSQEGGEGDRELRTNRGRVDPGIHETITDYGIKLHTLCLSPITRATGLKTVFSKHGKVVAAQVVTNAKTPGARCYGFVTMATSEDAQRCSKGLHFTELHGRLISVEAVTNRPTPGAKKPSGVDDKKSDDRRRDDRKRNIARRRHEEQGKRGEEKKTDEKRKSDHSPLRGDEKSRKRGGSETHEPPGTEDMIDKNGDGTETGKVVVTDSAEAPTDGVESDTGRSRSSRGKSRESRGRRRSTSSRRSQQQQSATGVLSFQQIKEEREKSRRRERERAAREEERRRAQMHRAIERKQRDEDARLERERLATFS